MDDVGNLTAAAGSEFDGVNRFDVRSTWAAAAV